MKNIKKIIIISIFLILVTALTITVRAYFTTYTEAQAAKNLEIGNPSCEVKYQKVGSIRNIQVQNNSTVREYVRVKILGVKNSYKVKPSLNWVLESDGYYYYQLPLDKNGGISENLSIEVIGNKNVITVAESTYVLYDNNNQTWADWNKSYK